VQSDWPTTLVAIFLAKHADLYPKTMTALEKVSEVIRQAIALRWLDEKEPIHYWRARLMLDPPSDLELPVRARTYRDLMMEVEETVFLAGFALRQGKPIDITIREDLLEPRHAEMTVLVLRERLDGLIAERGLNEALLSLRRIPEEQLKQQAATVGR